MNFFELHFVGYLRRIESRSVGSVGVYSLILTARSLGTFSMIVAEDMSFRFFESAPSLFSNSANQNLASHQSPE